MLLRVSQFIILIREDKKKIHFGTFHISLIPRQSLHRDRPAIFSQVEESKNKKILTLTPATTFKIFAKPASTSNSYAMLITRPNQLSMVVWYQPSWSGYAHAYGYGQTTDWWGVCPAC